MPMEFVISHDGRDWLARQGSVTLSAPTLEALDLEVAAFLRARRLIAKGEKAEVFMAFDNATIPQWIRQYAQHYFNRIVVIEG